MISDSGGAHRPNQSNASLNIPSHRSIRKSLNPVWNEDFIFEVIDDSLLQDAPLELRVVDQDLYSSELIGIVYIDLNPLISRTIDDSDKSLTIKGWFPLFDTLKGVRGDIYVI